MSADGGLVGVRVFNLAPSFEITAYGSRGTRLASWSSAFAFWGVDDLKYAALKAINNSILVMWLICALKKLQFDDCTLVSRC